MLELQAGVGFGGAARQFYFHHRTLVLSAVLSAAGLLTGTACANSILQGIAFADMGLIAAGVVLAAAIAFWHTRHLGLAAVTALAPVPGLLWAAPFSGGAPFGAVPALAYGFGFAAATLVSERTVAGFLAGTRRASIWPAAVAALIVTAILAVIWFRATARADGALQAAVDSASAVLSVFILLPLARDVLHFDEAFVARANRARERRIRVWDMLANVAIPRWAFSFTGIALVFLALGWFGAAPAMESGVLLKFASVAVVAAAAGILAVGWRLTIAIVLIGSAACLMALWANVVAGGGGSLGVLQVVGLTLFLAFYGGRQMRAFAGQGDPPVIAGRRTVEAGAGPAFAAAGAFAALLPGAGLWPGGIGSAIAMVMAAGLVVVFVPAAAIALEVLIPRRHSVEELYGRRRKPV